MIVTVFRQRTRDGVDDEYHALGAGVIAAAQDVPGLISFKRFRADDGENCTIVEFEDEASHNRWLAHPVHRVAMRHGRHDFFEDYTITVCQAIRVLRQEPHEHVEVRDD
ncbi:antibiotic biosynthesis monooxygenase family protein [Demetria terragena]|uniref:antibiotic biosynthesis monooxygenase family protein n=1 Tax=Demetria terragena TaxID=63959 RepID=UPI0014615148|nr:antibiotic biosynthesis monooxygenase [Demetria terragena]